MSQCISTPTATEYGTFTTESPSTTFTDSVTTAPAVTTTIESVLCAVATGTGSVPISSCITTEYVTVIPGGPITTQVPIVVTVPVTTTSPTQTLYTTTCSDGGSNPQNPGTPSPRPNTPSPNTPSPRPPSATPTPSPSTSYSVSLSSSTAPGGSVIVVSKTATLVITPTVAAPVSASTSSKAPIGPIVGGVIGGLALIGAIIVLIIWMLRRKHRMTDDEFEDIEEKIKPFPVKTGNRLSKAGAGIDGPGSYYGEGKSGGESSEVGMSNSVAGQAPTNNIQRRNPSVGYVESTAPTQTTSGYDRPVGGMSAEGSVLSGSGSGSNTTTDSRRPLMISNPNPAAIQPMQDVKNPQIYLSTGGVEVRGESSGSGSGPSTMPVPQPAMSSSQAGGSSAPYQHQDAGLPQQAGPLPRKGEPQSAPAEREELPPPAYEA